MPPRPDTHPSTRRLPSEPPAPPGNEGALAAHSASGAVARFLGHSAAAACGFVGLALIALAPLSVMRVLHGIGFGELATWLHPLEAVLQVVDVILFLAVFLAGAAVFATEVFVEAERRIIEALKRRHR
jgi:hypothetical protein